MQFVARRLLSLLQLTRMALVFTAMADSLCMQMLWAQRHKRPEQTIWEVLRLDWIGTMMVISIGLYAFGMSLNDIIDRRRDEQLAAHRPLPSGRLGVLTAHIVSGLFAVAALAAGVVYTQTDPGGWVSLVLVAWTLLLIVFYDFTGKYLVAPGLLTLGLIRAFHASIAAPGLPVIWQPLLLLNHVTILSAFAYQWEDKRPTLTRTHWYWVLGGLAFIDTAVILGAWFWRRHIWFTPGLLLPLAAVGGFLATATIIRARSSSTRSAGQSLMLAGLLRLIAYDAAFAVAYVGWKEGGLILLLLPIAYLSVQLMRWWGRILALSHRPAYKRAE